MTCNDTTAPARQPTTRSGIIVHDVRNRLVGAVAEGKS